MAATRSGRFRPSCASCFSMPMQRALDATDVGPRGSRLRSPRHVGRQLAVGGVDRTFLLERAHRPARADGRAPRRAAVRPAAQSSRRWTRAASSARRHSRPLGHGHRRRQRPPRASAPPAVASAPAPRWRHAAPGRTAGRRRRRGNPRSRRRPVAGSAARRRRGSCGGARASRRAGGGPRAPGPAARALSVVWPTSFSRRATSPLSSAKSCSPRASAYRAARNATV